MHFVSLKDTPGQELALYAGFYKDKFPKVFQEEPDSDASEEEVAVVWRDAKDAKAFANYEDSISKIVKEQNAVKFLEFLT